MKIVLYVRVSTDRQAEEGVSLPAQISQMKNWAETNGHLVVDVYEERGQTATDDKRPEFQRLMRDALSEEHPFDLIVIWALSRFMRDSYLLEVAPRSWTVFRES